MYELVNLERSKLTSTTLNIIDDNVISPGNTLEAFNHSTSLYPTKDSLYPLKDSLYPVKDNLYPSSKDSSYPGVKEDCYSSYYSPCVDQKQIPIRNNFHSSSALTN